jgi:hypothetical protein
MATAVETLTPRDVWAAELKEKTMSMILRGLAVSAVLASAALGLGAGTASAKQLTGNHDVTVVSVDPPQPGTVDIGDVLTLTMTPCGADCTTMAALQSSSPWQTDLHLQGASWTGTGGPGGRNCAINLSDNAPTLTIACPPNDLGVVNFSVA